MAAIAHDGRRFTRAFDYRALTGKFLVLWISGRLREGVANRGSTVGQNRFFRNPISKYT